MGALKPIFDTLQAALTFIIVLPILVAVHELGHFWAARLFGMHVDAFAVMMGGVRKTDLSHLLKKPLAPGKWLWVLGLGSFALILTGVIAKVAGLVYVGLFLLGIVFPVWMVTRLGALYHLPAMRSMGVLLKAWGLAILLSVAATRGQRLDPGQVLALASIASFIGMLIVYYNPVFNKTEEAPQGHGQVDLESSTGVDKVPVRFRPLLARTDKHGTEFSLLCWPLGGFAAIKGMHPREDGSETQISQGFYSKSPFARFCVLFAGPLFSVLLGVVLLAGTTIAFGKQVPDSAPIIGNLGQDSAAAKAGIKIGDKILTVNGEPVETFFGVTKIVRKSLTKVGDKYVPIPVQVTIERKGTPMGLVVIPKVDNVASPVLNEKFEPTDEVAIQAKFGLGPRIAREKVPVGDAIANAAVQPIKLIQGIAKTFSKPAALAENVGGPAAIAQQLGDASKDGLESVIVSAALLSLSLGIMNLLPIIPLDGGQIVIALAEMLRGGRRLSIQLQSLLSTVGVFLIFALMITVVTMDIGRLTK